MTSIKSGDVLLDCVHDEHESRVVATGIVIYCDKVKVLVNWIDHKGIWGIPLKEIEEFDLRNPSDVDILNNMKEEYSISFPEN